MFELLHKKVKLKSGIEGIVIGFYQDKPELPFNYLIRYWEGGKKSDWFDLEDFTVL